MDASAVVALVGLGLTLILSSIAQTAWLVSRMDRINREQIEDRHEMANRVAIKMGEMEHAASEELRSMEARLNARIANLESRVYRSVS